MDQQNNNNNKSRKKRYKHYYNKKKHSNAPVQDAENASVVNAAPAEASDTGSGEASNNVQNSAPVANQNGERNNGRRRNRNRNRRNRHKNRDFEKNNALPETTEDNLTEELDETVEAEEVSTYEELVEDGAGAFEIPDDEIIGAEEVVPEIEDDEERVEVVGIRFRKAGKIYYFDPGEFKAQKGGSAIVETARGPEFGEIMAGNKMVKQSEIVPPLRPVIRLATDEDVAHNDDNRKKEEDAFKTCVQKIKTHGLDMKLIDAQYTFDNSKLLFYFTSSGRVDFRDLVKDLASVFKTRIELRQIGIRDEAKLMGGLGMCGRPLCCATFLSDFVQVSIKMAKEQSLSLNSTKISGNCGRLMCCLRYEYDVYADEIRRTPPVDSTVKTPDGVGTVTEITPLAGMVKVRLKDKPDIPPKQYHRDNVKVLSASKRADEGENLEK